MIPLRASNLKFSSEWPQYIIIHHTAEFTKDVPKFQFDTNKSQATEYMNYSFRILKKPETMYHFLVDRQGEDYNIIVSQPLLTECDYPDLDDEHKKSIHIAVMGNYDIDLPPNRLYKVLSYRILAPLMRMFYLSDDKILFHSAISDEDHTCPGEFFDMTKLMSSLRESRKRKTIRRR